MSQRSAGLLIAGVFGALFILLNAHAPLHRSFTVVLSALALLAVVGLIGLVLAASRAHWQPESAELDDSDPESVPRPMFGTGYKIVVGAEVVAMFGGIAALRALGAPEETIIAWVALVVGLHFIGFVPVWRDRSIAVPGVLLTLLGAAGLVLAGTSAVAWVPMISGVLSGVALLACCLFAAVRQLKAVQAPEPILEAQADQVA